MAEYNEVIKQFKRMCRYTNHSGLPNECPLYCKGHGCNISHCRLLAFEDKKFQSVVMAWAAEHQEPVYETWHEYLAQNDILEVTCASQTTSTTSSYPQARYIEKVKTLPAFYRPIPADIAVKLGLEPKERR